jgi:membrane protein DedA with SNARE-associated domain/pimeloyl-ACP methyl ester carboxylesterase
VTDTAHLEDPPRPPARWSWRRRLALLYLAALAASTVWQVVHPTPDPPPLPAGLRQQTLTAQGPDGPRPDAPPVTLAWAEWPATPHAEASQDPGSEEVVLPANAGAQPPPPAPHPQPPAPTTAARRRPTVLLLHGSPGSHRDFAGVGPALAAAGWHSLAPDLPGFGASSHRVPDYGTAAHARYLLAWLDAQTAVDAPRRATPTPAAEGDPPPALLPPQPPPLHLVGFSLGGAVALEMARLAPERVGSLTLLSATGVQELELLGDARLNRGVHGLQLALLQTIRFAVPHFGAFDRSPLGIPYARNFYDTDQRPLRQILAGLEVPVLILHGARDPLVPLAAALEHRRIVPQSELVVLPTDHFHLFREPADVVNRLASFFGAVESGTARRRAEADPARLAAAAVPFDPRALPRLEGLAAVVVMVLLAVATFVSEDLATIGAGLLVAHGRLSFAAATLACFLGIFFGDLLLFWAGRVLGRRALRLPPLSWWLSEESLAQSSAWFARRGAAVILLSRVLPGTRLPTYVAAGVLRTSFWRFAAYFAFACALWTPALVGVSWWLGAAAMPWIEAAQGQVWWLFLLVAVGVIALRSVLLPLCSWEGRRRLLGKLRRFTQWEFWPPWMFYPPVLFAILRLAIRHRGLTVFTAANPGIPTGGFIGESKADILRKLGGADEFLPRWELLPAVPTGADAEPDQAALGERVAAVERFRTLHGLAWPLVLKPNVGQRGSGVAVVRDLGEVEGYFRTSRVDTLVQEFVAGPELGIFYVRHPEDAVGRIFSVTRKELPFVVGDGQSPIEDLILRDERAIAMADFYLERQGARRWHVPAAGERVQLVELGTHCRGAIFLDGAEVVTPALTAAIERISRACEGFYFGRYDVRTPSLEALAQGELRVIELNGVTAEATSIYDPRHGVREAWATLAEQWRLAFEIGAWHRDRGVRPAPPRELLAGVLAYRREQKSHPEPPKPSAAAAAGATGAGRGQAAQPGAGLAGPAEPGP